MKKSLILAAGCLATAAHAQLGLSGSGTQTVFRLTPVVPVATQAVLSVDQPPFPTARTTPPEAPRSALTLAQAFSNLTQSTPSPAPQPAVTSIVPPATPSVVPPPIPVIQTTRPEIQTPVVHQPTLSLPQAVSNLPRNTLSVNAQPVIPASPVVSSVSVPTPPTVEVNPPEVSVPAVQPMSGLSQTVSNLTQNIFPYATQPSAPSASQPTLPAAFTDTPVAQGVSVLNQAVSILTQRVSAVNQTAISVTQPAIPAVQTDISLPTGPATSAIPEVPSIAQPALPVVQLPVVQVQDAGSGLPAFHVSNAGIRPPSPKFRQVEIPYYGIDESNVAELPVGLRFYEYNRMDGTGLESTWTNGVFAYEDSGRYAQRLSVVSVGGMIVTNTIAEQIRMPVVSTNISQVGNATFVSEKTSFLSQGIWVGDMLKYPVTSTAENNKIVTSSLNGKMVKLSRKEDIILELAQTPSIRQGVAHLSTPMSENGVPALEALPRATANVPRMAALPDLPVAETPQMMVPSLPSPRGDTNTLSLIEAQARGLDIRLREVTVIKWVMTTNNYNNLPRRTPVPHKMWVLGSEPVAERFELF